MGSMSSRRWKTSASSPAAPEPTTSATSPARRPPASIRKSSRHAPIVPRNAHYICHHREMYGLPRKFNIAFDGGGTISALAETNDIGFMAVRVGDGARSAGRAFISAWSWAASPVIRILPATRAFFCGRRNACRWRRPSCACSSSNGDRTDRKKARLKYVLDRFGLEKYLEETQKHLKFSAANISTRPLRAARPGGAAGACRLSSAAASGAALCRRGAAGRPDDARLKCGLSPMSPCASAAARFAGPSGKICSSAIFRPTRIPNVKRAIEAAGLHWSATNVRAGLIACTGNAGCKYAASHTKRHAMAIADYLDGRVPLDQPLNIHVTGCHNSCAQHYIGDIGSAGHEGAGRRRNGRRLSRLHRRRLRRAARNRPRTVSRTSWPTTSRRWSSGWSSVI